MSSKKEGRGPLLVVGIAVSTGCFSVLQEFFRAVNKRSGIAYLITHRLEATEAAQIEELLCQHGVLSLEKIKSGAILQSDAVYFVDPGTALSFNGKELKIDEDLKPMDFSDEIDYLWISLAVEQGPKSVGVLFTGAGVHGLSGFRAIGAHEGLIITQSQEEEEGGQPSTDAFGANLVDRTMKASAIPDFLDRYSRQPFLESSSDYPDEEASGLHSIFAVLQAKEDFDLSQYKESTVRRRISRRLSMSDSSSIHDYAKLLKEHSRERRMLMRDLMINVTDFFRDQKAFDILSAQALRSITHGAEDGETIRIWVAGCATGEEAYSIAMLAWEAIVASGKRLELSIFATDVLEESIRIARKGVYAKGALERVPDELFNKYFSKQDDDLYGIKGFLRDKVSFATQNIYADPPFSRMHLISCRNLLIYLRRSTQDRVLKSFFFSLRANGFLFLGTSESIGDNRKLFRQVSPKWRIYQKMDNPEFGLNHRVGSAYQTRRFVEMEHRPPRVRVQELNSAQHALLSCVSPSVVIGVDNQILYIHGDASEFLYLPSGVPQLDLFKTLHRDLRSRVRSAAFQARRTQECKAVTLPAAFTAQFPEKHGWAAIIKPVQSGDLDRGALVISFEPGLANSDTAKASSATANDHERMIESLEHELQQTQDELRSTTEELETSTEELKASHEEALSTNEELQSANEELEASTEELRSLNEKLSSMNAELRDKVAQIQSAHDDLENFFASTNLATIFVDNQLMLRRCTPAAERLLKIGDPDIGRSIAEFTRGLIDGHIIEDATAVIESLEPSEREIVTESDRWFSRKILPFRTADKRIDGAVITFIEITELKNAVNSLAVRERQQAFVAKFGVEALSSHNFPLLLKHIVREVAHALDVKFCKILKYRPETNDFLLIEGVGWDDGLVGLATVHNNINTHAGYTLEEQSPVIVEDLAMENRFKGAWILREHGIVSGLSCVIHDHENPFGILTIHTDTRRVFSEDDANFLMAVANLITTAFHRDQAEAQLEQSERRLIMARNAAQIGIHDYNLNTNEIRWDEKVYEIWGIPSETHPITYQTFERGLHPDDREKTARAVEAYIANPGAGLLNLEYRVINQVDGKLRWVEATGMIVQESEDVKRLVGTVQDITRRKLTEIELKQSEQKLRIAQESHRVGVFEYYIGREDTNWDPILYELWGISEGEKPTQQVFREGVFDEDLPQVEKALSEALHPSGDGHYHVTYRVVNRLTGKISWVEASGQTFFEDNEPIKMIGMIIDISEQKRLEESLQTAIQELEVADEKKNRFLATLGHELRNPLATISTSVYLLKEQSGDTAWILKSLENNIDLISSLLDELLDLTRITRGKLKLKMEVFDIKALLESCVSSMRSRFEEKNQELRLGLRDSAIHIRGDRARMEQVFMNLLTNALKFTEQGGFIEVSLDSSEDIVVIKVRDNGIGIAAKDFERIFDPFEQVEPYSIENTGLGIGLSLVKQLVELHHGKVTIESEGSGKGATFLITLPRTQDIPPTVEEDTTPSQLPRTGLRILIIDDNVDAALGLAAVLRGAGCEVATVHSGAEALEVISKCQPEALLVDIGLEDINGNKLIHMLKAIYRAPALYVAVTGFGHDAAKAETMQSGFDHHLTKPVQFKSLLEKLSHL